MNDLYPWAANQSKLDLAINAVRIAGLALSEENVKAEYVRRAGLMLNSEGAPVFAEKKPEVAVDEKFVGTTDDIPAAPKPAKKVAKKK